MMDTRELHLPIDVVVFGDEIRALKRFYAEGLLSSEEAYERIEEWGTGYPAGWHRIVELADARRGQPLSDNLKHCATPEGGDA